MRSFSLFPLAVPSDSPVFDQTADALPVQDGDVPECQFLPSPLEVVMADGCKLVAVFAVPIWPGYEAAVRRLRDFPRLAERLQYVSGCYQPFHLSTSKLNAAW